MCLINFVYEQCISAHLECVKFSGHVPCSMLYVELCNTSYFTCFLDMESSSPCVLVVTLFTTYALYVT